MSRFALLAGLMTASVAAQAEFTVPGFKYIGCVEAEPPVFNFKANVPAPFSVQQCQYACHAKGEYAAMDVCSVPCIGGNTTAGVCGGPQCPVTGKKRYSLYKKEMDHHDDDDCEEEKTKSKDIGVWTKYISTTVATITACPPEVTDCPLRPLLTAPEKAVMSPRHQPSPLKHRVLRNVALHALLKAARFVLLAVPFGLLSPTLLRRHQFQHAMESTASWVFLLQQH